MLLGKKENGQLLAHFCTEAYWAEPIATVARATDLAGPLAASHKKGKMGGGGNSALGRFRTHAPPVNALALCHCAVKRFSTDNRSAAR